MKYLLFIIMAFFISGCENTNQKPIVLDNKKQRYANEILSAEIISEKNSKIEAKTKKEIAMIEMKKAIETKKIESQAKVQMEKIKSQRELEKTKLELQAKSEANSITKTAVILFAILGFGVLILIYILFKKYQENKISIEREKMRLQKEIKEKEIKAKMAEKLIDALSSGNFTKEQEEMLLSLINQKNVLEYKG
ncbi:hypothetical protein [Nitrosophilus labii]|uniref:hypothetical protein n=1 Tax=Nitrosophilus labii TaxID=2706014 RepID=UPI001656D028|nr:hypothetical protein [Nitrosophilus labii]